MKHFSNFSRRESWRIVENHYIFFSVEKDLFAKFGRGISVNSENTVRKRIAPVLMLFGQSEGKHIGDTGAKRASGVVPVTKQNVILQKMFRWPKMGHR